MSAIGDTAGPREWQPGDPIHTWAGVWIRPIFELLGENHYPDMGVDAARWPEPLPFHNLDYQGEL